MSTHLLNFLGVTLGGMGGWQTFVYLRRRAHNQSVKRRIVADADGRKLKETFFAGSTDDIISDTLQTGDLVFFNHDCSLMKPCGSGMCGLTKMGAREPFDHVGVVVVGKDQAPRLLEHTFEGPKLRPWDERLSRSLAEEIIIRPLRCRRTKAQRQRAIQYATDLVEQQEGTYNSMSYAQQYRRLMSRAFKMDQRKRKTQELSMVDDAAAPIHQPTFLVATMLQEFGWMPGPDEPGYSAPQQLLPSDLLEVHMSPNVALRPPVFVRTS